MLAGFDNEKYLAIQGKKILDRLQKFKGKLYIEFGGKLFDDYHASRVLPGFQPDSKIKMLETIKDSVEILIVINSNDIIHNKIRSDIGLPYNEEVIRLISSFRNIGFEIYSIVLTMYKPKNQLIEAFEDKIKALTNVKVYHNYEIEGYPSNIELIASKYGYGKNDHVETKKPVVIVTAPGPYSGKMSVCLSQIYLDYVNLSEISGYAKFETFPVWNLPIQHPINIAYEAATLDLGDVNLVDPFHFSEYSAVATNYNRDVEAFPILKLIFEKIYGYSPYKSPTDMGVNMVGSCIINDDICKLAAKQEIVRRYYNTLCYYKKGLIHPTQCEKASILLKKANININEIYPVVDVALQKAKEYDDSVCITAIQINADKEKKLVTGKSNDLFTSESSALINALKTIGKIPHDIPLIPQNIIEPIIQMKNNYFKNNSNALHVNEILIALTISATTNPLADIALKQLPKLRGSFSHSTKIMYSGDEIVFRKIGLSTSSEPKF